MCLVAHKSYTTSLFSVTVICISGFLQCMKRTKETSANYFFKWFLAHCSCSSPLYLLPPLQQAAFTSHLLIIFFKKNVRPYTVRYALTGNRRQSMLRCLTVSYCTVSAGGAKRTCANAISGDGYVMTKPCVQTSQLHLACVSTVGYLDWICKKKKHAEIIFFLQKKYEF